MGVEFQTDEHAQPVFIDDRSREEIRVGDPVLFRGDGRAETWRFFALNAGAGMVTLCAVDNADTAMTVPVDLTSGRIGRAGDVG